MFNKFKDYMYYLLHEPIRNNQVYILFTVMGNIFDQIKEDIFEIRKQANILTATGRHLDMHGKDRKMPRLKSEDDESYRRRLLMKAEIAARAGTLPGLKLALKSMGYETEVNPLYLQDTERWAEFYVLMEELLEGEEIYDFRIIKETVMDVKQASAKPNYGFRYTIDFENNNLLSTKVYCIMAINFYDNIPLYLDGTWYLDGTYILNGSKLGVRKNSYMGLKIGASVPNEITYSGEVQIDATWYLDGTYMLDGSKKLNGAVWKEELA